MPRLAALAVLLAAAMLPLPARACTSLLVGAGATDDGSSYIARNVDHGWSSVAHQVTYVPAQPQQRLFKSTMNAFSTTLPADGLAYWSVPAEGSDTFESSGVNSAGVAISATETIYPDDDIQEIDPLVTTRGITEDSIPSVLLPQARSARQAVELMGALIEKYGAGEGFGVLAADQNETWYLESAGAHHWMAKRLPNDTFLVAANQGRFQGANWTDPANVLYSEELREFPEYWEVWDPTVARFSLRDVYMQQSRWDSIFNYPRVRELQLLLAGVDSPLPDSKALMPPHPEFLQPNRSLSLFDVMSSMRNHYNGSDHDGYFKQNPREEWHPVAMTLTGMGHVTRIRPASASLPPGLQIIQYVGLGTPAWVPYVPIYTGLNSSDLPPALVGALGSVPDPVSLWWKGRRLLALMFRNWPLIGPGVEARLAQFDRDVDAARGPMEGRYIASWQAGNQTAADAELAAFTAQVVADAGCVLDELSAGAVQALALPGMPDDRQLKAWLNEATMMYQLDPLGLGNALNPFSVEW